MEEAKLKKAYSLVIARDQLKGFAESLARGGGNSEEDELTFQITLPREYRLFANGEARVRVLDKVMQIISEIEQEIKEI